MQPNLAPRVRSPTRTSPEVFPYGTDADRSQWPATPGAEDCPACGSVATNVQGLLDCTRCAWPNASGSAGAD